MTKAKTEAERILVNFLRTNISDPNSSNRSGQWIFPDFPRVNDLGDNSFPRIGITTLTESSEYLGLYDNDQYENINFQIDIVAKKGKVYSVTVTDEASGTMASTANSNRMTYVDIPNSVTNIKHSGTAYGTIIERATNSAFTTLSSGTVEYSYSTGDLNFASADITSHDGQAITSTYVIKLEGKKLCQYLARKIIKSVKNTWRTDTTLNGLHDPIKINNIPIPFDEEQGIFRQTVEYQFKAFNVGEGL